MKKIIQTNQAPNPIGPYNQAILTNNTLYTSGQIAMNINGKLIINNIKEETKQVLENLKAVLRAVDMTFENVVKTTIFLTDMNDFTEVNKVYATYFNEETAPARETVEVANLPKFVHVEISLIATK